ncbi:hypothetical protein DK750_06915 [Salmonella enterica subsp. enterica serovar Rovaniemi]|nr:hypothetical protein [Salmonella enterica subsp. enterica serovar Rovaniemi]EGF4598790.1 hypothetical protein [Salmonella enterica subsp. enterica serovar Agama]EHK8088967.1 hypothetical protein [Salmonella enterica subsp. enterica serovar Nigeria]
MNLNKQFDELFATYNARANEIISTASQSATTAENDPFKYAWAKQEGFEEAYDPNANEVVWSKRPEPAYNVPELMKVRGSVSPETFAETFPEYQVKTQKLDGLLQDIYQQVLDGKITQQRGEELAYQLMSDTWKEAKKQGKPSGAGAKSSSEQQTASKVMKGQKILGESK